MSRNISLASQKENSEIILDYNKAIECSRVAKEMKIKRVSGEFKGGINPKRRRKRKARICNARPVTEQLAPGKGGARYSFDGVQASEVEESKREGMRKQALKTML